MKLLFSIGLICVFIKSGFTQEDVVVKEECLKDIDLVIVLDGSFSVTSSNFEVVKTWVKRVAEEMHIGRGHVQIGVVQYSHYYANRPWNRQRFIRTEIELGEYQNMADFNAAVDRIRYQGYKTYTAHALNKTLIQDFVGQHNRYPEAQRAIILLTDGKATDSEDLPPVIEKAHNDMGVVIYAVGVGQYVEEELLLMTENDTDRVFTLKNFEGLERIVRDLQLQLETSCDCDAVGSTGGECDPCSGGCPCKTNVVGRRCDSCSKNHYGFKSGKGCLACACNPFGSLNQTCDLNTGQCECRPDVRGRACGRCSDGLYGFPECRQCQCNGFSQNCDEFTGVCTDCAEGRRGDHCEICAAGHYFDEELNECVPCICNGNIDLNDPESCNPVSGVCQKCLHNTTGNNCEKCEKFYHGDALMQQCVRCQCNSEGTDPATCEGNRCICSSAGECSCLSNVQGRSCDTCTLGSWNLSSRTGCLACGCSASGAETNTTCDKVTGECICKEAYTGMKCTECNAGYDRELDDGECFGISDLQGDFSNDELQLTESLSTTASTTTASTRPRRRKPLPVNPGWSPCVSCGGQKWPSYCRGWMCQRRWPYYQQTPSTRRCYSWQWGCRTSVEQYQQRFYQPSYSQSSFNSNYRQPAYYRGYNHHPRNYFSRRTYRNNYNTRYSLYRN